MRGAPGGADFAEWYLAEWPRLVATFSMVAGSPELGQEVAAEAAARALERWDRVGRMASPRGWTYSVGYNLLRRHHRRRALEHRALQRARAGTADAVPPRVDEVWDAVRALPERERTMIALRYAADLTEPQIAALLGVVSGTVSTTLHRARARLRVALLDTNDEVRDGRA